MTNLPFRDAELKQHANPALGSVSVIVCAYTEERWSDLVEAINSVQHQTIPPDEIILVIDHNPHLFAMACAQLQEVYVIENRDARGLSGARNTAILAARGNILAFIDDDAIADHNWLASLLKNYHDPHVLGVGGSIEPGWAAGRPGWFPEEFDWVVGCTYRGMPTRTAPVRNLIGANMSYRRKAFQLVGLFRNGLGRVGTLPMGCEETEFCIRVLQKDPRGRFIYEPAARVCHRVPAGRAQARYFFHRCYAEGLSKAQISTLVGSRQGLASERSYVHSTLPRGFVMGLRDAFLRGKRMGLARAGMIAAGLACTTGGYLRGKVAEAIIKFRQAPRIKVEG